jgi:hypothetical protein
VGVTDDRSAGAPVPVRQRPRVRSVRVLAAVLRALTGEFRMPLWLMDLADERRAPRSREAFGRRGWLLTWQRDADGRWRARLSSPGVPRTVERTASSRRRAVARAALAMDRLLSFRAGRAMADLLSSRLRNAARNSAPDPDQNDPT